MPLSQTITEHLKQAMLNKDDVARDALRMLKADLMKREVDLGRPLTDPEELEIVTRNVKTRRESIEQYTQGGRADLANKESAEIAILERFLPKALGRDEAEAAIRALAAELGASSAKDMGKLMKAVKERFAGQIEGKLAADLAKSVLS